MKKLQTERLLLRPWRISDAESLHYYYARDKRVGPYRWLPQHYKKQVGLKVLKLSRLYLCVMKFMLSHCSMMIKDWLIAIYLLP